MASSSGNGSNSNDAGQLSYDGGGSVSEQNPSVSTDWTPDDQAILEDGLSQYASESNIIRYAKIAVQLQNKTVRDVALRCRWMFINTDDHQEQANLNRPVEKEKMKKKRSTIMVAELPSENIYHILSRLPVKSLARFQCVSKLWRNYINDPYLQTLHAKRAVINDDQMLISFHNASASRFIIRFLEYKQAPGP
ncbi:uncharacterized protein LOC143530281 [Bidens hawaiensis]|uniref:uncharacterized protein LOC143530281 n=1 Tax=Bidens hawaiensis TaxID=980011 RepID=UPI00404A973C